MAEEADHAPAGPSIDRRSLVLHAPPSADVDRRIVGAIAVPLARSEASHGLIADAHARGLGVVLPGAEQRPDVEDALDAQLWRGATIALMPAHAAEAALDVWHERQAWRPPPQRPDGPDRALYASIVVDHQSAEDYADLAVDGFWLTAGGSGRQMGTVARFALELQGRSGLPVVVTGAGDAHLGLLAAGVAAVCAGDADERVFHGAILSSFPPGPRSAPAQRRLFMTHPCDCGAHLRTSPPAGRPAILAHNRWQLEQEAFEAASMPPVIAEHRLLARAGRASAVRRQLGLPPLAHPWSGVAAAGRDLRGGEAAG